MLDLTIIIVSWKVRDLVLDCLRALPEAVGSLSAEVVVVDNASDDGTAEAVRCEFPQVRVIENRENLGFSKANNLAIRDSNSRYILLLNPDTIPEPNSLQQVVEFMDSCPRAAAATSAVYTPDGRPERYMGGGMPFVKRLPLAVFQRMIRLIPFAGIRGKLTEKHRDWYIAAMNPDDTRPRRISGIEGAVFFARREVLSTIGLLDEEFFFGLELTEWSLRFRRAGWRIFIVPAAKILHLGGRSAAQVERREMQPWAFRQFYHFKYRQNGRIGLWIYHHRTLIALKIREWVYQLQGQNCLPLAEYVRKQTQLFRDAYQQELAARRQDKQ